MTVESPAHQGRRPAAGHVAAHPAPARNPWRAVAVPTEHGGWGLTLEPVLLGLVIVPSVPGAVLGLVALLAFLARTPLKLVLVDRWRGRSLDRTRRAAQVASAEVALLAALLVIVAFTAEGRFWIPLVAALPLVGLELWFDMRSRSRRLVPELAGTIGIGSVAAAIVLAGGEAAEVAAGAWWLIGARAIASIPFVRFQILRGKRQPARRWAQDLAQLGGAAVALAGVDLDLLPWIAGVAVVALAAVQFVLARLAPPRPAIAGAQQLVMGVTVTLVGALALR